MMAVVFPQQPAPDTNAEALMLLREIRDELRAIRSALSPKQRQPVLCNGDRAALETLLPAISEAVGTRTFSTRELLDHAKLEIPQTAALRAALVALENNPRKLGRLLSRGADVEISGFCITESGTSRGSVMRTVIRITRRNSQKLTFAYS